MARVIFDENRCKGCGLCVKACSRGVIRLDEHKINKIGYNPAVAADMEKCIGCTLCALMCPDVVITVEK
jgi:2-oxoglutarate ferredoxin oxidoreductase subunit delta